MLLNKSAWRSSEIQQASRLCPYRQYEHLAVSAFASIQLTHFLILSASCSCLTCERRWSRCSKPVVFFKESHSHLAALSKIKSGLICELFFTHIYKQYFYHPRHDLFRKWRSPALSIFHSELASEASRKNIRRWIVHRWDQSAPNFKRWWGEATSYNQRNSPTEQLIGWLASRIIGIGHSKVRDDKNWFCNWQVEATGQGVGDRYCRKVWALSADIHWFIK